MWQPIETAPKDGTPILVWDDLNEEFRCAVVKYDSTPYYDEVYGWKNDDEVRYSPRYWMPLPLRP